MNIQQEPAGAAFNRASPPRGGRASGFTLIELIVAMAIIAVLASVAVAVHTSSQDRMRGAQVQSDMHDLSMAITIARNNTRQTLGQITASYWSAGSCGSKPAGTDLAALPRTDACWVRYTSLLSSISTASNMDVTKLVDPWGRPYAVDENEGEGGGCGRDAVRVFAQPYNGGTSDPRFAGATVSLSGNSGCLG